MRAPPALVVAVCADCTLVPLLVGLDGGKPGSPTGPVRVVSWLWRSLALLKSSPPKSEVVSVAAEAEEAGRLVPSRDWEGYGSWERKVGMVEVAVGLVGLLEGGMVDMSNVTAPEPLGSYTVAILRSFFDRMRHYCLLVWASRDT